MSTKIFINLPVKDLAPATDFYTGLGYTRNPQFSDATTSTGAIMALGVDSREQVDELAEQALALGGQPVQEPMDHGFMYGRSFADLDGHHWEVVWMDPNPLGR